jgi:hypothetical protein
MIITAMLIASIVMHPVLAQDPSSAGRAEAGTATEATTMMLQTQRRQIESRLIELGRDRAVARTMASLLTPDDLAVLTRNPKMVQTAAGLTSVQTAMLLGILILVGIIAIAAAGDGVVIFSS